MNEKKDEFKEWVVSTFDKEAEQELRRLQEKEEKFEVPEGVKEAVFERLQEQLRERNERNASRQEVEEDGNIVGRQNMEENDDNVDCGSVEEADDIINKLSPEDREALELGRKMMKAEIGATANDRKKSRGRKRPLKIYMAMGITSIGGPERVVRMVRQAVGDRDVEQVDSSEENKIIDGEEEEEAYEKIKNVLAIEPVRIISSSAGLKFENLIYDKENQVAELHYGYSGKKVVYFINASYMNSSFGMNIDDKKVDEYEMNIDNHVFTIKEYTVRKKKKHRYMVVFKESGVEYYIIASVNADDFEKIINNLFFP